MQNGTCYSCLPLSTFKVKYIMDPPFKKKILWTQEELMLSINLMRFDVMVYMFPSSTAQVFVIHVVPAMLYRIGMPMRLISMFWLPIFKSLS